MITLASLQCDRSFLHAHLPLTRGWANSGPRATFGPRKYSENIFKSEISSNVSHKMLVLTA